jgi:hypothetical protein
MIELHPIRKIFMKFDKSSTRFKILAQFFTLTRTPAGCAATWAAAFLAASGSSVLAAGLAQPFTPGDIVVERFGDNSITFGSAGAPIFLDEMTPGGTLVQSIEIPTNGPGAIVDIGNSGGDVAGGMTLSGNGQYLVFPGYNTNSATPALSGTGAPRAIGQIDANGNYTLPVKSTAAFTGSSIRGAASDGAGNYWGSGTSSGINGGIEYFGTTATATQIYPNGANANLRCCGIFNGNLCFDTASSTAMGYGIYQFNGLPTVNTTPTKVITLTSSYASLNLSVSPDGNTIYVADDGFESGNLDAGIHKWTYNGTAWSQAYLLISNTPCYGIAVNYLTTPATIYATSGSGATNNSVIVLQDNGQDSVAVTNVTCLTNEMFRGVAFVPTNATVVTQAPVITGISPTNETVIIGGTASFNLFGSTGNPVGSNLWYQIVGSVTNQVSGQIGASLILPNATMGESGNYFAVITNAYGSATSSVVTLSVTAAPTISSISPSGSVTKNAGSSITFTLTDNPGIPTASNNWYQVIGTTTNFFASTPSPSLTINNLGGIDDGEFFAVLTNSSGRATSAVVTLTITNDPHIEIQPANSYGLVDGVVQFAVTAAGSAPSYQWYFTDHSGNLIAPITDSSRTISGAVLAGGNSSLLSVSNVQTADLTNFVVVVSDAYGSQTSSIVSILEVTNVYFVESAAPYYEYLPPVTPIALWDFNGPEFTNSSIYQNCITNPQPYLGVGTATTVGSCNDPGTSPFSGSIDPNDDNGFDALIPGVDHLPDFSWGSSGYPASASNKLNGVQFNVSTIGAKNILLAYDSRVSATASDYERVQYTTNGTDWIDYPSSSTFAGIGTTYEPYQNDFTGFPGVANNPNFGVRIVTEVQYTATYGIQGSANTNAYLGTANAYGTGGTVTYDLVGIYGDAITNGNVAPTISSFMDTNTLDNQSITLPFTVSGDTTADKFTYSAVSLNPTTVSPTFSFTSNVLGNCTLTIRPNSITQPQAAAPILVSVTDTNGDTSKAWFLLTLTTTYLPPTNTLTAITQTNTLANTTLVIPFRVGSQSNSVTQFTYGTGSGNNTVVPSQSVVVTGQGTANPTLTVSPGSNVLGVGTISVTVNDMNPTDAKSTTATIPFMVRPNTNIVFVDYFNYDQSGPLDEIGGFWQQLTGTFHGLPVVSSPTGGYATVDTADNTENIETPLINAPYSTNANAAVSTLYYSMMLNLNPANTPNSNGTYFAALNDGVARATSDVEALLLIATNDVVPGDFGDYQVGIANDVGATVSTPNTEMYPQDLTPGSNYVVVVGLTLSNGVSTVWVNPSSQSSPSVTSPRDNATVVYKISDFELRQSGNESGDIAGAINVSYIKVGTTFDSVFPSLHAQASGTNVIVNWSDPTLGIQSATNLTGPYTDIIPASPPYTNNATTNSTTFFRFGR